MSLPPALLERLAQRGLLNKNNAKSHHSLGSSNTENEEIIAEDYDELETAESNDENDNEYSQLYKNENDNTRKKNSEENFWLGRMRERMGVAVSHLGYKNCPNKYNIWHKCTLYCVKQWENAKKEPSEKYMRRYRRMLRKYPLPKGWIEVFDPGCGCYYFVNAEDNMVSWLPPTHPKSRVSKSAATYRSQLESSSGADNNSDNEHDHTEAQQTPNNILQSTALNDGRGALQDSEVRPSLKKRKYRDIERTLQRKRKDANLSREKDKQSRE